MATRKRRGKRSAARIGGGRSYARSRRALASKRMADRIGGGKYHFGLTTRRIAASKKSRARRRRARHRA